MCFSLQLHLLTYVWIEGECCLHASEVCAVIHGSLAVRLPLSGKRASISIGLLGYPVFWDR